MGMLFSKKTQSKPLPASNAPKPPQGNTPQEGTDHGGEDISHMPIHEAVANHGPADKIEMMHDHEGGQHSVTSHHGGKKHHSSHGSASEAHEHAKVAGGADQDDMANEGPDMGQGEEPTGKIPGMSKSSY